MDDAELNSLTESHDSYAKRVMRTAFGRRYSDMFTTEINYGVGQAARIDGTIDQSIAVELESRVSKQVRGAVLDLLCHSYPKKLLVLLPVHMSDVSITARQCEFIFSKFLDAAAYRVVVLAGCGSRPCLEADIALIRAKVQQWQSPEE